MIRNRSIPFHLLLYSCLFLITSCALFQPSPLKLYTKALEAHKQYDAIIVPGVPFNPPDWDSIMKFRVVWAVNLYKKGYTKKIIMSGSAVYSPYVEAKIMKLYAMELGVPEEDILTEEKAEHTTENVWNSFKLGHKNGYKTMALASDPFQTRMMYRFIKKRCKGMKCMPVLVDTFRTLPYVRPVIKYEHLRIDSFKSIVETQTLRYRLRGTRGKHINFKDK